MKKSFIREIFFLIFAFSLFVIFNQSPARAQTLTDDQMANDLYQNQKDYENYRTTGRDDGKGHIVGGFENVCPDLAVVCDTAAMVFCVSDPGIIPDGGLDVTQSGPVHSTRPKVSSKQCQFARDNQIPKGNEIEPSQFHVSTDAKPADMNRCGFAKGAGRIPCQYVGVYDASTKQDILDKLRTNDDQYGSHQALIRDTAWARGYDYAKAHGWVENQPITVPPVVVSAPPPPPPPPPPPDACLDKFDWQADTVDCAQWDNCQQKLTNHLLASTCSSTCSLADCEKSYNAVGAASPTAGSQAAVDYFEQNKISERAHQATQSISAFLAAAGSADLSGSYYASGMDQCFFSAVLSLTSQRQSTTGKPTVSGSCNSSTYTPKLSVLQDDLKRLASGQPIDNLAQDTVRSILGVYRLANLAKTNKLDGTTLLASTSSATQAALSQPLHDMLTSLKALMDTPGTDSFYDLFTKSNLRQYLSVPRNKTTVMSPQDLSDSITKISEEFTDAGATFCVIKPDPRALDAYDTKYMADVKTAAELMDDQNVCHPPPPKAGPKKSTTDDDEVTLPPAGPKKNKAGATK